MSSRKTLGYVMLSMGSAVLWFVVLLDLIHIVGWLTTNAVLPAFLSITWEWLKIWLSLINIKQTLAKNPPLWRKSSQSDITVWWRLYGGGELETARYRKRWLWRGKDMSVAPFILPFGCGDTALILCLCLCVNVLEAARGEILLWRYYASGGSIRGALLANRTSVNG